MADYFTMPLQGSLFKKVRDVIMSHARPDLFLEAAPPLVEERVKNKKE